jgi:hypothetical protein
MTTLAAAITAICFATVWALVLTMLGDAAPRLRAALRGEVAGSRRVQPPLASRRFSRA